jgi:hypothetical protein
LFYLTGLLPTKTSQTTTLEITINHEKKELIQNGFTGRIEKLTALLFLEGRHKTKTLPNKEKGG